MNELQTMESRIWAFIECSDNEAGHKAVDDLIQSSPIWRAAYEEALLTHKALQGLTTSQPSLRFTQNVMDMIAKANPSPAPTLKFNPWVVRGIVSVFALLFIWMVAIGIFSVSWTSGQSIIPEGTITGRTSFKPGFIAGIWPYLVIINIIAGLILLDAIHHRRQRLMNLE